MKIELTKYSELAEYMSYFLQGIYEIMIIEGAPGIGKSSIVKDAFKHLDSTQDFLWLEGRTSAAAFYQKLYQFVDCPIILDDTDDFLTDRQCLNLLKTLCQTDSTKRVQWLTTRLPHDLPAHFYTSSTVILLTNEARKTNIHLRSIQDRGLHIHFRPTKQEIHQYARKLCNTEVYSFIDLFLPSIEVLTLRLYVQAQIAFDKGIPWRNTLILSWQLDPLMRTYLEIEINYPTHTREEKQDLFLQMTGKQAKTYQRIQDQLHQTQGRTPQGKAASMITPGSTQDVQEITPQGKKSADTPHKRGKV